jgi:hypothetical protein
MDGVPKAKAISVANDTPKSFRVSRFSVFSSVSVGNQTCQHDYESDGRLLRRQKNPADNRMIVSRTPGT